MTPALKPAPKPAKPETDEFENEKEKGSLVAIDGQSSEKPILGISGSRRFRKEPVVSVGNVPPRRSASRISPRFSAQPIPERTHGTRRPDARWRRRRGSPIPGTPRRDVPYGRDRHRPLATTGYLPKSFPFPLYSFKGTLKSYVSPTRERERLVNKSRLYLQPKLQQSIP